MSQDVAAIHDVLIGYCDRVDALNVTGVMRLFTRDCRFDYGFGRIFEHDELARLLRERLVAYDATSHHLSNIRIELHGPDRATATSAVVAWHRFAEDGREAVLWGRYTDELQRVSGQWQIRRRVLRAAGERGFAPASGQTTAYERLARELR